MQASKLNNILITANNTKQSIWLKAERDFPIGEPKIYRIIRGSPSRVLFIDRVVRCVSNDGVKGFNKETLKESECASCKEKSDGKCIYRCALFFEHESEFKEYCLYISYSSQISLSDYIRQLLAQNLDAPDVLTRITRIETGADKLTKYTFELEEIIQKEIIIEQEEQAAIDDLLQELRKRNVVIDIEEFAETLVIMLPDLDTNRSLKLAESVANKDGVIK